MFKISNCEKIYYLDYHICVKSYKKSRERYNSRNIVLIFYLSTSYSSLNKWVVFGFNGLYVAGIIEL